MTPKLGLTDQYFNTRFAPLGALLALYKQKKVLQPLKKVETSSKMVNFSTQDKLEQVLVSIFAGCSTLSEVNSKLKSDQTLTQAGGWKRFADQSTLSLMLDGLSQMNIEQLRTATCEIWHQTSSIKVRDWRGFLWLDYDLSGLACSQHAELGEKGYFSGKKTQSDANWHVSVPSITKKPFGQICFRVTSIRSIVCQMRSLVSKLH